MQDGMMNYKDQVRGDFIDIWSLRAGYGDTLN